MPTPALLNFDELTGPIPGDEPSGGPIPFALREQLDTARKVVNPDDYDANDPTRPAEAKWADWPGIVRLAGEALVETSKDLLLGARLTEALTHAEGFAGLRDGLRLLRLLVEGCWDRLRPPVEEPDDLEARAAPFHWLDDNDRGARFPLVVRGLPLLTGPAGPVSWSTWHLLQSGRAGMSVEDFDRAAQLTPREHCQAVVDDLDAAWDEVERLTGALDAAMGDVAPGLSTLRQAIRETLALARQLLDRKGPPPSASEGSEGDGDGDGAEGGGAAAPDGAFVARTVRSRAELYQRLAETAGLLQELEPQSPIPYLIRRAVELGGLSFPELMKRLITDASVLSDMGRNLGVDELQE